MFVRLLVSEDLKHTHTHFGFSQIFLKISKCFIIFKMYIFIKIFISLTDDPSTLFRKGVQLVYVFYRYLFTVDVLLVTLREEDFAPSNICKKIRERKYLMFLYYEKWTSLVMLDGVYSAVESSDSITFELNQHDIHVNGLKGLAEANIKICYKYAYYALAYLGNVKPEITPSSFQNYENNQDPFCTSARIEFDS